MAPDNELILWLHLLFWTPFVGVVIGAIMVYVARYPSGGWYCSGCRRHHWRRVPKAQTFRAPGNSIRPGDLFYTCHRSPISRMALSFIGTEVECERLPQEAVNG